MSVGANIARMFFRISSKASSAFHLKVLQVVFIKLQDPSVCRQWEFFSRSEVVVI